MKNILVWLGALLTLSACNKGGDGLSAAEVAALNAQTTAYIQSLPTGSYNGGTDTFSGGGYTAKYHNDCVLRQRPMGIFAVVDCPPKVAGNSQSCRIYAEGGNYYSSCF